MLSDEALTYEANGAFRWVCTEFGHGLLESGYVGALVHAWTKKHVTQVLHYVRVTDFELALLFNFGPRPEIKRFTIRNALKQRANASTRRALS